GGRVAIAITIAITITITITIAIAIAVVAVVAVVAVTPSELNEPFEDMCPPMDGPLAPDRGALLILDTQPYEFLQTNNSKCT
ncbi:MAG: hypothetical protein ACI9X4_002093, partial [Glaciecola sp.]